jgi:hypothetical protein
LKAIDALLDGLIDYAGLFPPASEDMRSAVERYASYLKSTDRPALGRFIVPLSRLKELEDAATDLMPRGGDSEPWRVAVLVAEDVKAAGEDMLKFNCHHWSGSEQGHAVIDVAELKASMVDDIVREKSELPRFFTAYFEIPVKGTEDVSRLIKAIAEAGARAKIRTGGVTPDAFPPTESIVDFMVACQRERVPFKATAGLHHPVRGTYPLSYEPGSPTGTMYGFLNLLTAAALVYVGDTEDNAIAALEEADPSAFGFEDQAIVWRGKRISAEQLKAARSELAISFGSCSFREPVDELAALRRNALSRTR